MKIITISEVGYNHPSQANWSYGIHKIDLIDTDQSYCGTIITRENFGGDARLRAKLKERGVQVIETKSLYTGTGTQKITGVAKLPDIESDEVLNQILDFMK